MHSSLSLVKAWWSRAQTPQGYKEWACSPRQITQASRSARHGEGMDRHQTCFKSQCSSNYDTPPYPISQNPEAALGGWGDLHMKRMWIWMVPLLGRLALCRDTWGDMSLAGSSQCHGKAKDQPHRGIQVCSRAPWGTRWKLVSSRDHTYAWLPSPAACFHPCSLLPTACFQ